MMFCNKKNHDKVELSFFVRILIHACICDG